MFWKYPSLVLKSIKYIAYIELSVILMIFFFKDKHTKISGKCGLDHLWPFVN